MVYGDNSSSLGRLHVLIAQPGAAYVAVPTITLPANVGTSCRALDAIRDGKQDLACAYSQTFNASLVTFLSNGDGTFGTPTYTTLPTAGGNYFDPGIYPPADLNSDGIPDLMGPRCLNQRTYVTLGDGNGSFTWPQLSTPPYRLLDSMENSGGRNLHCQRSASWVCSRS
jgi:hypothetical protein